MNEVGVDPGIDHMLAMECFDEVRAHGGKVGAFCFLKLFFTFIFQLLLLYKIVSIHIHVIICLIVHGIIEILFILLNNFILFIKIIFPLLLLSSLRSCRSSRGVVVCLLQSSPVTP